MVSKRGLDRWLGPAVLVAQASLGCCGLGLAIRCHSSLLAPDAFPATPFPPQRTGAAQSWKHLCPTDRRTPPDIQSQSFLARARERLLPQVDSNLVLGRSGRCCHTSPISIASLFALDAACQIQGRRQRESHCIDSLCGTDNPHTVPRSAGSTKQSSIFIRLSNQPGPNNGISLVFRRVCVTARLCRRTFQLSPPHAVASSSTASTAAAAAAASALQDRPNLLDFLALLCFGIMTSPVSLSQPI